MIFDTVWYYKKIVTKKFNVHAPISTTAFCAYPRSNGLANDATFPDILKSFGNGLP